MKHFDQILYDRLIDKELEPYHLTRKDIATDDPDWFSRNTMTEKEAEQYKVWALVEIRSYMKCSKKMAEKVFREFNLMWGLRIKS